MRSKRRNTNLKILQSQLQHLAVEDEKPTPIKNEIKGGNIALIELPVIDKIKKKGIKKDELINTKRLLTC